MPSDSTGRFAGRTAIVTGGGRGIGQAIANRFASEGAEVLVFGRTRETLESTVGAIEQSGGRASLVVGDVSSSADVSRLIDTAMARWQSIDMVVNNAAIFDETPFLEIQERRWREVIDVNLTGVLLMSQQAARVMAKAGYGSIVTIASIDAYGADGAFASYNTAKAGLLGLTRTMAMELAPYGIRVNTVSPGYTLTPMTEAAVGPALLQHMLHSFDRVPMRRLVQADEIASACAFLCSLDASAITGTDLVVDCGTTANLYIVETLPEGEQPNSEA